MVPLGQLSSEVFSKYELSLQKTAATMRIKRWMVKVEPITSGTTLFEVAFNKYVDIIFFFINTYLQSQCHDSYGISN